MTSSGWIDALARRIGPHAAAFARSVLSLHDAQELRALFEQAGFRNVEVRSALARLDIPAPHDFLWHYIASTPMLEPVMKACQTSREALEHDITEQWQRFRANNGVTFEVRMTTAIGRAQGIAGGGADGSLIRRVAVSRNWTMRSMRSSQCSPMASSNIGQDGVTSDLFVSRMTTCGSVAP